MHPILVVDDEQAIAMLIRRILTDAGYRCEAVTDSIHTRPAPPICWRKNSTTWCCLIL